jgi:exopolysaccharide biosynthesis polyprenyl glycosylphosphotransferase
VGPIGRQPSSLRRHLVAGDIVALVLTWGALVGFNPEGGPVRRAICWAVAVVVTLAVMRQVGLYRARICALRSLEAIRVFAACVAGTSAFIACEALGGRVDAIGATEAGGASVLIVLVLRWRFGRWLKARRQALRHLRPIVLVGANEDAQGLWAMLKEEPELGFLVGGVVGQMQEGSPWEGVPHCATVDEMVDLAKEAGATGVIVVASAFDVAARSRAVDLALASGLHVQVWPGIHGLSSRRVRMSPVSGVPLLYVEPPTAPSWELVVKRAMDLVLGAVLCVVAAPFVGVAALAIKMSDGGPVMYRSKRAGRRGEPIEVLKMRTMVPNAAALMTHVAELNERKGGPLFKATDDPRVTKVGRILRATSIDELPQLWNVLQGTMSLVGPRPALLDEVEHFDQELHRRHDMRPGMTGLWQVEARDNPSFSAYRRLDLSYIDDWSLSLDLAIMASTGHEIAVRAGKAIFNVFVHRSSASGSGAPEKAVAPTLAPALSTGSALVTGSALGDGPALGNNAGSAKVADLSSAPSTT